MDPKTEEALDASIKHWEEVCSVSPLGSVSIGSNACALCQLFKDKCIGSSCRGCPVFEKTGCTVCNGTPYIGVYFARHKWRRTVDTFTTRNVVYSISNNYGPATSTLWAELMAAYKEFILVALEELKFLRSLKPSKTVATGTLHIHNTCPYCNGEFEYKVLLG